MRAINRLKVGFFLLMFIIKVIGVIASDNGFSIINDWSRQIDWLFQMKYDLEIRTKILSPIKGMWYIFHELNSLGIKFTAVNEIMVGLPWELPRGKFPLVKYLRGEFPHGAFPQGKLSFGKLPRILFSSYFGWKNVSPLKNLNFLLPGRLTQTSTSIVFIYQLLSRHIQH